MKILTLALIAVLFIASPARADYNACLVAHGVPSSADLTSGRMLLTDTPMETERAAHVECAREERVNGERTDRLIEGVAFVVVLAAAPWNGVNAIVGTFHAIRGLAALAPDTAPQHVRSAPACVPGVELECSRSSQ